MDFRFWILDFAEKASVAIPYYAGFGMLAKFKNVETRHGASLQRLQSGKIETSPKKNVETRHGASLQGL